MGLLSPILPATPKRHFPWVESPPAIEHIFRPKWSNAITLVQKKVTPPTFNNTNSETTVALDSTPTNGNVGVMIVYEQSTTSNNASAGWTKITALEGGNGVDVTLAVFYKVFGAGESSSWTWTWTTASFNQAALVLEYSGVDTSNPIDVAGAAVNFNAAFGTTWSEASITLATANALDIVFVNTKNVGPGFTIDQAGYTEELDADWGAYYDKVLSSSGATGARTGTNQTWSQCTLSFALRPASGATREQEGYRFRADDGSESAATWLASQDTDISRTKDTVTRLRTLIDVTGDAPSEAVTLQYRKVGAGSWRDVPGGI